MPKLLKGIIPLGGYSYKKVKRSYKRAGMNEITITGDSLVQVLGNSTGGNFNITFDKNVIKNFLDSIGDNEFTTSEKQKAIAEIVNYINKGVHVNESIQASQNVVQKNNNQGKSSFQIPISSNLSIKKTLIQFEYWLYGSEIKKSFTPHNINEMQSIWENRIQNSLNLTSITFIIKDSTSVIRGSTIEQKKSFINEQSESIYCAINDSTSTSKDGFNNGENISIFFKETFPGASKEYVIDYENSPLTAVIDGLLLISGITYNDAAIYNSI